MNLHQNCKYLITVIAILKELTTVIMFCSLCSVFLKQKKMRIPGTTNTHPTLPSLQNEKQKKKPKKNSPKKRRGKEQSRANKDRKDYLLGNSDKHQRRMVKAN